MKVLIVGIERVSSGERYRDDKGWSFGRALAKLGHEVDVFTYKRKGMLAFLEKDKRVRGRWQALMNRRLRAHAAATRPEMVLLLKAETVTRETIEAMRRETPGVIVNIFPDNPLLMGNVEAIAPCHYYFVKDTYVRDALWRAGFRNVQYLPQCTDSEVHRPMDLTPEERASLGAGVSLLGTLYPYRERLVEELVPFGPVLWGRGWEKARSPEVRALATGRDVRGDMKSRVISASAISLNPHHPLNDIFGVNRRTYDIAACRGFQLADLKPDMRDLFAVGEEIVCFSSLDELKEKIAYYLDREGERRAIAEAGYRRVLRDHTYERRTEEMLAIVAGGARP
jgi:spore maturation protein CgeB